MADAYADADPVFRALCSHWERKLEHARSHKRKVFQDDADECMAFYNGPRSWDEMMRGKGGLASTEFMPHLKFKMSVNKAFELVTLFGPALYYQDPVRTVTPRHPLSPDPQFFPDPYMAQAIAAQQALQAEADGIRAMVLAAYLNWLPVENDLSDQSRQAIEEALIKGRGCLWTELYTPEGTTFRVVRSVFDSVDNLFIDPDASSLEDATWIARRCVHPVWRVERDYGMKPGTLKGNMESQALQAEVAQDSDALFDRKRGLTNDLLVYWKIYSKMGIGGRLSGINKRFRGPLEMFGDYVYLVIAKGVPFPLNLPTDVQRQVPTGGGPEIAGEVLDRLAWPTPFWAHPGSGWPVSELDFHKVPRCPWPLAHLRAGMGELKFLNWAHSFLTGKIYTTTRDFLVVKKEAGDEVERALVEGRDLELIKLDPDHKGIAELVQFLQHPEVNGDIWKIIAAAEDNFNKRVGLNELMYGAEGATQIRSAQEAQIRNQNLSVRPDDMAKQVEAWMSRVAQNEAICARYHLASTDVAPVLGVFGGQLWDQYVATQDLSDLSRQLDYRIESGSMKRPNKETEIQNVTEGLQVLLPIFQAYAQLTGDMGPLNNLVGDWARARDLDPARYQMQAMPMMPATAGTPGAEGQPADAGADAGAVPAQAGY